MWCQMLIDAVHLRQSLYRVVHINSPRFEESHQNEQCCVMCSTLELEQILVLVLDHIRSTVDQIRASLLL